MRTPPCAAVSERAVPYSPPHWGVRDGARSGPQSIPHHHDGRRCRRRRGPDRGAVELRGAAKPARQLKAKESNSQVEDSNSEVNVNVSVVEYSVTSDARIETITFLDEDGEMVTKTNVGRSWSGTGPADHGTVLISATTGTAAR